MWSPMGFLPAPGHSGGWSPQAKAQLLCTMPPSPDSSREGWVLPQLLMTLLGDPQEGALSAQGALGGQGQPQG